jgi:hypothetical protein
VLADTLAADNLSCVILMLFTSQSQASYPLACVSQLITIPTDAARNIFLSNFPSTSGITRSSLGTTPIVPAETAEIGPERGTRMHRPMRDMSPSVPTRLLAYLRFEVAMTYNRRAICDLFWKGFYQGYAMVTTG